MALDIHGYLCYELLRNLLYLTYDVALVIMFGLFLQHDQLFLQAGLYSGGSGHGRCRGLFPATAGSGLEPAKQCFEGPVVFFGFRTGEDKQVFT